MYNVVIFLSAVIILYCSNRYCYIPNASQDPTNYVTKKIPVKSNVSFIFTNGLSLSYQRSAEYRLIRLH